MALYNAYSAHGLSSYDKEALRASLELAALAGQTIKMSTEIQYVLDTAQDVKPFPAPVRFGDQVYVDARTFAGLDRDGKLKIRNPIEHLLRLDQARWEIVWSKHDARQQVLMAQFPSHHEIFGKWVGDLLTHTYALTPYQSAQVQMLAGLYSVGQFINHIEDPLHVRRLQEQVSRELRFDKAMFESITSEGVVFPRDLKEFVEQLHTSNVSSRLADVTPLSILQAAATGFPGISNDRQLCSLAVEYPPALLVIIHAALRNNVFNRTRLGQLVNKSNVAKNKLAFNSSFERVMNQNTAPLISTE